MFCNFGTAVISDYWHETQQDVHVRVIGRCYLTLPYFLIYQILQKWSCIYTYIINECGNDQRKLYSIIRQLSPSAATKLINSFITSNLNYCNHLYHSLSKYQITKQQSIQITVARILNKLRKHDQITQILKLLHWFPVKSRIVFKSSYLHIKQ